MRLEITSGETIKNATVDDLVAALDALKNDSMTLIASDQPRCLIRVSGGPEQFKMQRHDGQTHQQFECPSPQDRDTTLRVLKAYLTGRGDVASIVVWEETTPAGAAKSDWEDPMEGQVNRGGCTTVLALAALLGGGLWLLAQTV